MLHDVTQLRVTDACWKNKSTFNEGYRYHLSLYLLCKSNCSAHESDMEIIKLLSFGAEKLNENLKCQKA